MSFTKALLVVALCAPAVVGAQTVQRAVPQADKDKLDFATFDRVGIALVCMDSHGGPTVETLTACTCRVDYIDSRMTYKEYEAGATSLRYSGMPGEKGAMFRDVPINKERADKLEKLRDESVAACPIARVSPDSRE